MEKVQSATHTDPSKSSKRRKYLGEAGDPHFIPSSPLISRQSLTFEQEEELTRSCAVALSTVPHSDDENEAPLMKHVTNQLALKPTRITQPNYKPAFSKPSACLKIDTNPKTQKSRPRTKDTATPSVISVRDAIDRTETSTPLTFFSDNVRKSTSTQQSNALRSESKASQYQSMNVYPDKSRSSSRQRETTTPSRSMIALAVAKENLGPASASAVSGKIGLISISQVEFDKSLPTLPRCSGSAPSDKSSTGISHFLKTVRRAPNTAAVDTECTETTDGIVRSRTVPLADDTKKHRFNLASLFNRRRKARPTEKIVS